MLFQSLIHLYLFLHDMHEILLLLYNHLYPKTKKEIFLNIYINIYLLTQSKRSNSDRRSADEIFAADIVLLLID
jgi:hypothetical protein